MTVRKYIVVPPMEGVLKNLREMAGNLWYTWNMDAVELFDHLDEELWRSTNHNPLQTLITLSRHRLDQIREDEVFGDHTERVRRKFRDYLDKARSYDYRLEAPVDFVTAYFSLEFGLTESLPIYSGGLGVLAGDHCKSASDLNVPLVGVGLMYQEGYFHQRLSREGWQQEYYPTTEFDTLPFEKQTRPDGSPLVVSVDLGGETLYSRVLRLNVGRVPLYLLDADIPENSPELRSTTARLYGGDREMRIRQEILLGIGGTRALAALGMKPAVFHLNEGHVTFTLLERIRYYVEEEHLSLEEALAMATSESVLTIHTPVPAGNDVFPREMMEKYFRSFVSRLGMDFEVFLNLGRKQLFDHSEGFCMTVLGLRLTSRTNSVSKLHCRVARKMWQAVWPDLDLDEIPISSVTNGVHIPSYISRDFQRLYDRYLEPGWSEDPDNEKIWRRADSIPDTELWRTHERCRTRLVYFARRRLRDQLAAKGAPTRELDEAMEVLDPEILTVCFGRRFATYKRATLLFSETETLAHILSNPDRPLQVIMAGKAHPQDDFGKEMIRRIVETIRREPFRKRIVFLEDYDLNVARYMVQGADVWLNTPRRPLEACGTSGMKASANGALNLSILDGWWDEAFAGDNGWAIGSGEEYQDSEYQDQIESRALYDLLEQSVKPLFYERGLDDLPREWVSMMKRSLQSICPVFNSLRMFSEYVESAYLPAATKASALKEAGYAGLREMVAWKKRIKEHWGALRVSEIDIRGEKEAVKGKAVEMAVSVYTDGHSASEFDVELLHGPVDLWEQFKVRNVTRLDPETDAPDSNGYVVFSGLIPLSHTGLYGYGVRISPSHMSLPPSQALDLILRA